ncbi:MAG: PSD1 and planctomycete cytochrome C domain-containing protein [Pirellulales bacterium]|nr:PSD1 and planctomycete cytochrome C domain-containing protein [Pirellulales bacterium]
MNLFESRPTWPVTTRMFCLVVLWAGISGGVSVAEEPIDFGRDIRPILSDNCFFCHGPDEENRAADLRLDSSQAALDRAIVPGDLEASELISRIVTDDADLRMPPPDSGKSLSPEQIDKLRRWVLAGANYQTHWAFVTPVRPAVPRVGRADWVRNEIDAFVLSRLEAEQLSPSPPAQRAVWLRRLSLDLIGLPPDPDEVDAFVADTSDQAYQAAIDRLLKSPHFGERWARIWLDAARYADSNGYEKDAPREMWFYRDWVIKALNRDLRYDDFVIQQIAGDLLDPGNQDALVATGFLRNSMINEEGGADPEQFRMEAMFDRMDAIGKSVLGLTIQCGQCHSHKYDPLTQHDYYRMFAFLNNTHDAIVPVYTPEQQRQREQIHQRIAAIEQRLKDSSPNWAARMEDWEQSVRQAEISWQPLQPIDLPYEGQKFRVLEDWSILSESYAPKASTPRFVVHTDVKNITGFRLELLMHPKLPRGGPGRSIKGAAALSEMAIEIAPADAPDQRTKIKLVAVSSDVNPAKSPQPDYLKDIKAKGGDQRVTGPAEFAIDGDKKTAWTTDIDPGRRNQPRKIVFVPETPIEGFPEGTAITFSPTMNHGGWNNNDNHNCLMGRYRFSLTTAEQPLADPLPAAVRALLEVDQRKRSAEQQNAVFSQWRRTVADWRQANEEIDELWKQYPEGTTQLVLRERERPRQTAVLHRGDFLSPEEEVQPGVPGFLHPLPENAELSRLTFAQWLVDKRSPTTARSIVNRIWQAYFGIGLVETSDELGSQSTPPSHPELLDWLAVELMENDWSLKHLHRLIVSSATYRQSSRLTETLYQRDPYNRLLARGPRFRVDAEIVRDITLSVSGLLNRQVGGPSVYPPAPRFLFDPPASYGPKTWEEEEGENRFRRGLYTFRFRSVPYPMLETFDAVAGNVSCVRRNRSNTPLQALTSLNEPLFLESAKALAVKTLQEGGSSDQSRLRYAMRRCVARTPQPEELATLSELLQRQRERIQAGQIDAPAIVGDLRADAVSTQDLAAWTLVARVLLNLDETITKE